MISSLKDKKAKFYLWSPRLGGIEAKAPVKPIPATCTPNQPKGTIFHWPKWAISYIIQTQYNQSQSIRIKGLDRLLRIL